MSMLIGVCGLLLAMQTVFDIAASKLAQGLRKLTDLPAWNMLTGVLALMLASQLIAYWLPLPAERAALVSVVILMLGVCAQFIMFPRNHHQPHQR